MSISKKEYYSDFLYGFNNNIINWHLIPLNEIEESAIQEKNSKPRDVELQVVFKYNKQTGAIILSGNQISSVLGYPSSSLRFNNKDIKDITKINSTYKFKVKSSPYIWEMTLSSKGVQEEESPIENNKNINSEQKLYNEK